MPHEPQTKELHERMLELLKNFHNFCINNNIKYSLHGGTLLGAIREKGFIPWDDDIDITFTREEFEKFRSSLIKAKELPFNYTRDFRRLIKNEEGGSFVWLDIIIYDYISENKLIQKIKLFILIILTAWNRSSEEMKLTKVHGLYTGWKYAIIYLLHLFGKLFPYNFKKKIIQMAYKSFPGNKQLIHRSNDQYIGMVIFLPSSCMSNYQMTPFEDTELMITTQYDLILKTTYGDDYMTPKKFDNDAKAHTEFRKMNEN